MTPTTHPEFPLDPSIIYLNHAAVAPWPRRTVEAVRRFADENLRFGATRYPAWLEVEQRLRRQLAQLIGAPSPADIALLKNTSEALSIVAHGIDWREGDNVVLLRQEFPSNRVVWESLRPRGVEVRELEPGEDADPEARMMAAADDRTRLITVSSVQYATGLRMDLRRLGGFCHRRGILFCVDAIQSLGALPFDVGECHADFVMADGHKWMLGPEGLALFYVRPQLREQLTLHQYGWHMLEHAGDFDRPDWRPAADARRFECGTPNMLGIHALSASLELLLQTGIREVSERVLENTRILNRLAMDSDDMLELVSSDLESRLSGIVSLRPRGLDAERVHRELMDRGVICACRGGAVRFSPHFHTAPDQLERAMAILLEVCRSQR